MNDRTRIEDHVRDAMTAGRLWWPVPPIGGSGSDVQKPGPVTLVGWLQI